MNSERPRIIIGYTIITLIWGSTWLAIKVGLQTVPPFFGLAFRFTLAAAMMFLVMRVRKKPLLFDRSALFVHFINGVFSYSLSFGMIYLAEQSIPSGLASVLFAIYPIVVAGFSQVLLPDEKMNGYKGAGIMMGLIGLVIIFWEDLHPGSANLAGMGAVILGTVSSGFALVFTKRRGKHIDSMSIGVGGMMVAVPILFAIAFTTEKMSDIHPSTPAMLSICYLALFGTVVTFSIYYWLLKRIEVVYLSLLTMMTPIIAVILGASILKESFSQRTVVGALVVLAGVLCTNGAEIRRIVSQRRSAGAPAEGR